MYRKNRKTTQLLALMLIACSALFVSCTTTAMSTGQVKKWATLKGAANKPGNGKRIVLIAGDEEYRSEETMPLLGKILATHHGFDCVVLFSQGEDGFIDPMNQKNIPGLENLKEADLMMIFTRFRDLPEGQMKAIDDYLKTGKPVIGLRTATHGFKMPADSAWAHYSFDYKGPKKKWSKGFGRFILGQTWAGHHGHHGREGFRGIIANGANKHPITRGIKNGDIWGTTDVYGVKLPLPKGTQAIFMGEVLQGMDPKDPIADPAKRKGRYTGKDANKPMMPIAWTKSYKLDGGKKGKVFTTTIGSAGDFQTTGSRRLLVNSVYWALGLDVPQAAAADVVGEFKASHFGRDKQKLIHGAKILPSSFDIK